MSHHDRLLLAAFERLRVSHLAFRRADPEEIRELEAMRLDVFRLEAGLEPAAEAPYSSQIAPLRLLLMERAFHVLRLDRYANAPENQGWMNLFREWGRTARFNELYDLLRTTLSPDFRSFYDAYLRDCPERAIDSSIHHPWLREPHHRGAGLFMDTGRTEPPLRPVTRSGAGGVDDAKGRSGVDQTYETGSGGEGSEGGGTPNE